jgi:DNA-binding response OmpR family regulator
MTVSLIKISLQKIQFNVFEFTDPFLALEHFEINSRDYGLVLSDMRMPGMPRFEFVRKVREINPKVKILIMSAFEISDLEFSRALPSHTKIDGFVEKPILPKELIKVIKIHLHKISNRDMMSLKKKRQYKEQPDEFLTMVCYYKGNLQSLFIIIQVPSKIYFLSHIN